MGWFSKTKKNAGLLVIRFKEGSIDAASVSRPTSGRPVLQVMAFAACEKASETQCLEKFGKELQAARYQCSNLLSAGEYQLLSVDAPNVPAEELKTAIRWRLKDMLDFHVDDATIDVLAVPVDRTASTRAAALYAVAARNQLIAQRQALFDEARMPLSVIDIPEMAQRNISTLLETQGRGLALLSFDGEAGLLTITHGGELYLARRIDVTAHQIARADSVARSALFERITLELQRSLDHFDRQYHFITLSGLKLAPLVEGATELQETLAANLYLPVESFNLEAVLDMSAFPDLQSPAMQQRCFLLLGAALRQEEKLL